MRWSAIFCHAKPTHGRTFDNFMNLVISYGALMLVGLISTKFDIGSHIVGKTEVKKCVH